MDSIVGGASQEVTPEIAVVAHKHIDEELRRLADAAGWSRLCREGFCDDFAEAE